MSLCALVKSQIGASFDRKLEPALTHSQSQSHWHCIGLDAIINQRPATITNQALVAWCLTIGHSYLDTAPLQTWSSESKCWQCVWTESSNSSALLGRSLKVPKIAWDSRQYYHPFVEAGRGGGNNTRTDNPFLGNLTPSVVWPTPQSHDWIIQVRRSNKIDKPHSWTGGLRPSKIRWIQPWLWAAHVKETWYVTLGVLLI